jgi:Lrp/AsnC family transcriptional regulator, regulator for asnA, asnC and gidA
VGPPRAALVCTHVQIRRASKLIGTHPVSINDVWRAGPCNTSATPRRVRYARLMREELSADDWKVIHLLAEDAADVPKLARELGRTVEEVTAHVEALRGRGVISEITARINPTAVGLPVTGFYVLHVAQNADTYDAVERMLQDIDQVEEAHAVSGRYDWLVKVRAASVEDLQHLLTGQLALLPGFVRAETLVVMSTACDYANVHAATYPLE